MEPLRGHYAFPAAQELPVVPWLAALPAKEFPGIASSAQAGNFLSANLTLPYKENSSSLKAYK